MRATFVRTLFCLLAALCLTALPYAAWSTVLSLDLSSVFNRDGVDSVADPNDDGFDNGGDSLIENGVGGRPGLPSDKKVGDFLLGDYDAANMVSIVPGGSRHYI
ncbi:MAG: hypothetical protein Q8Q12_03435 [bacterium]|nr:hypothetical protein [bacterium]